MWQGVRLGNGLRFSFPTCESPQHDVKEHPEHLLWRRGVKRCDCLTLLWHTEGLLGYGGIIKARLFVAKLYEAPVIGTHWPQKHRNRGLGRTDRMSGRVSGMGVIRKVDFTSRLFSGCSTSVFHKTFLQHPLYSLKWIFSQKKTEYNYKSVHFTHCWTFKNY